MLLEAQDHPYPPLVLVSLWPLYPWLTLLATFPGRPLDATYIPGNGQFGLLALAEIADHSQFPILVVVTAMIAWLKQGTTESMKKVIVIAPIIKPFLVIISPFSLVRLPYIPSNVAVTDCFFVMGTVQVRLVPHPREEGFHPMNWEPPPGCAVSTTLFPYG